jgi:hypothetical protein
MGLLFKKGRNLGEAVKGGATHAAVQLMQPGVLCVFAGGAVLAGRMHQAAYVSVMSWVSRRLLVGHVRVCHSRPGAKGGHAPCAAAPALREFKTPGNLLQPAAAHRSHALAPPSCPPARPPVRGVVQSNMKCVGLGFRGAMQAGIT